MRELPSEIDESTEGPRADYQPGANRRDSYDCPLSTWAIRLAGDGRRDSSKVRQVTPRRVETLTYREVDTLVTPIAIRAYSEQPDREP